MFAVQRWVHIFIESWEGKIHGADNQADPQSLLLKSTKDCKTVAFLSQNLQREA